MTGLKCVVYYFFYFFSQLKVSLVEGQTLEHFDIKEIEIEKVTSGEIKRIYHLNYTTWPDYGVPSSTVPILQVNITPNKQLLKEN